MDCFGFFEKDTLEFVQGTLPKELRFSKAIVHGNFFPAIPVSVLRKAIDDLENYCDWNTLKELKKELKLEELK